MMYFEGNNDYEIKVNSINREMYMFMALIYLMGLITFSSNKGLLAKKAFDRRAASIFGKAYEYEEVLRYVYFLRQFVDTYDDDI